MVDGSFCISKQLLEGEFIKLQITQKILLLKRIPNNFNHGAILD